MYFADFHENHHEKIRVPLSADFIMGIFFNDYVHTGKYISIMIPTQMHYRGSPALQRGHRGVALDQAGGQDSADNSVDRIQRFLPDIVFIKFLLKISRPPVTARKNSSGRPDFYTLIPIFSRLQIPIPQPKISSGSSVRQHFQRRQNFQRDRATEKMCCLIRRFTVSFGGKVSVMPSYENQMEVLG